MRILFFANPCSPHDTKWINLLAKNHEVEIISQAQELVGVLSLEQIKVHPVLPLYSTFKFKRADTCKMLKQIIADFKPDVIHSMYMVPNSFWANEVKNQIPHIITTRGSDILVEYPGNYFGVNSRTKKLVHKVFDQKIKDSLRKAAFVTCTSPAQADVVKSITSTPQQIIATGVDIERIISLKKSRQKSSTYRIFCPRYMKPVYNIDIVVEAFNMLLASYPESELTLIDGNNSYASEVKNLVEKFNITSKVKFLPNLNFEELIEQYCDSDLTVMIPESDGTPNTALESMLCETPLLLGNAPYSENLFSTDWLWKIDQNNPEVLCSKMKELKTLTEDLVLKKVKIAADHVKRNASLTNSIDSIRSIYNQVS